MPDRFQATCPRCGDAWDERPELIGTRPESFASCAFRCHPCGIAFSNSSNPAARVLITRTAQLNVPEAVRDGLDAALAGAVNLTNRPTKRRKFCSARSEDAVTWTVARALEQAGSLGALAGDVALGAPRALLLWGHPAAGPDASEVAARLEQVSDELGEKPTARSEPDVVALWPSLLAVVEAKLGSANDRQIGHPGYRTYLPAPGLFAAGDDMICAEGSYQLMRNWVIGSMLAAQFDVPLRLVNLGPASVAPSAARFGALLAQSAGRRFEHRRWAQVLDLMPTRPPWLDEYAAARGLAAS